MKLSLGGRAVLVLLVVCAGANSACGKKGPPLAPLARVPSPPANPQAMRVGDDAYVWFVVPTTNVSGQTPAEIETIELYAFTGTAPPPDGDPTTHAIKIGTYPVRLPLSPPPPPPEGAPVPPPLPVPPGFEQGATAVVRETLTPEALMPTPLAPVAGASTVSADLGNASERPPAPLVAPADATALKRFYFLLARGSRGRISSPTAPVAVPVEGASAPPADVRVEYTAASMTIRWAPSADARAAPPAPDASLLPSRPLTPPPPPTGYFVFDASRQPALPDPYAIPLPTGLTPQPVSTTELTMEGEVRFGVERCFVVRAVDRVAGSVTMGRASQPACVTPVDTFPPAPPQRLAAIAGVDVINLIWEANTEPDLAGYIVLRGAAPGDTLQALTPMPIRETTYRDQSVRAGERYVYAVVAVDTATPQNVSGQSNRVEESSRPPR